MLVCGIRHINDQHVLAGWEHDPNGLTAWKFDTTTRPGLELMRFQSVKPSFIDSADNVNMVFSNGNYEFGIQADDTSTELVALPAGRRFQNYSVYQTQNVEEAVQLLISSGFFDKPFVGDSIKLKWNMNTDDQFDAYLLYWDAGVGGTPNTLLATIEFRGDVEYIHTGLGNGTYQYWLKFKDYLGNTGVYPSADSGKIISVAVTAPPAAPVVGENYWDDATRKYVISATTSDSLIVYSNWLMGEPTLLDYVHYEHRLPMLNPSANSYTTHELAAGDWILNVHSINDRGILSDPETITFRLEDLAGTLTELTTVTPLDFIQAELQSGAAIKLTWYPTGVTIEIYYSDNGGTSYSLETTTALTSYTFSGVDATAYLFKARVKETQGLNTVYSDYTDPVGATADGSPPSGDQTLTAEVL